MEVAKKSMAQIDHRTLDSEEEEELGEKEGFSAAAENRAECFAFEEEKLSKFFIARRAVYSIRIAASELYRKSVPLSKLPCHYTRYAFRASP
jgi:hypothetical protein